MTLFQLLKLIITINNARGTYFRLVPVLTGIDTFLKYLYGLLQESCYERGESPRGQFLSDCHRSCVDSAIFPQLFVGNRQNNSLVECGMGDRIRHPCAPSDVRALSCGYQQSIPAPRV